MKTFRRTRFEPSRTTTGTSAITVSDCSIAASRTLCSSTSALDAGVPIFVMAVPADIFNCCKASSREPARPYATSYSFMLVAGAAELLSVSMESAGLIYLHNNNYSWSFILLLGHVAIDLFAAACLSPIVFVSVSSVGPLVALIMAGEKVTACRGTGVGLILAGVISGAMMITQASSMCCKPNKEFFAVLGSGAAAAVVLSRQVHKELCPKRGGVYRIVLIATISMIATANLVVMELVSHCGRPELAIVCVGLLALEVACVKQSLRVSPLSAHVPAAFACYQLGGIAIENYMYGKQPFLPLLAPMLLTITGIYTLMK